MSCTIGESKQGSEAAPRDRDYQRTGLIWAVL